MISNKTQCYIFLTTTFRWLVLSLFLIITACSSSTENKIIDPTTLNAKPDFDKVNIYVLAGDYYEMQIGVRGNKLTGVYKNPMAKDKDESCFFFFEGQIGTKNPVEVTCYDPMTSSAPFFGSFKILGEAIIAKLRDIPSSSCNPEFTDEIGHSLVLDKKSKWSEIRVVAQAAELVDDPKSAFPIGSPLIPGSIIGIRERKGSWLWVDVINKEYEQGWIEDYILYPLMD